MQSVSQYIRRALRWLIWDPSHPHRTRVTLSLPLSAFANLPSASSPSLASLSGLPTNLSCLPSLRVLPCSLCEVQVWGYAAPAPPPLPSPALFNFAPLSRPSASGVAGAVWAIANAIDGVAGPTCDAGAAGASTAATNAALTGWMLFDLGRPMFVSYVTLFGRFTTYQSQSQVSRQKPPLRGRLLDQQPLLTPVPSFCHPAESDSPRGQQRESGWHYFRRRECRVHARKRVGALFGNERHLRPRWPIRVRSTGPDQRGFAQVRLADCVGRGAFRRVM